MPQNKPMKIQWITVNGRQVPLVLPQTYSYADDDWKVTSDRDPLPIVEYGTTEGGVIVPKRVSDEGHELTQLTGSNIEVVYGSYDQNINVNAGQAMSIKIEPPENEVWKLQVLRVDFPPVNGATTGNHRLIISTGTVGSGGGILDANTAHNKRLFVVSNRFSEDTVVDISKEWVQYVIRETFVSKEAPLYLYYLNQTDANIVNAQIPIRITRVVYKK